MSTDAALWLRVSTLEQRTENQQPTIGTFTRHHGLRVVRRFEMDDSAWKDDTGGPEYQRQLKAALDGAWRGEFSVLVVWALDRLTRLGAEDALRLIRQFRERGVVIVSIQESWLNGSPEVQDILVAFAGWMAQQESRRHSERVKAGMARAKAEGKVIGGRQPGARDRRPRRTDGYAARWERERAG